MLELLIGPLTSVADTILKRVLPGEKMSEEQREAFKAQFQVALLTAERQELETRMSAILAEAKSADPWTSRARPAFLYVMYLMILFGVPMGVLAAFQPEIATRIAQGLQAWLKAIPDAMWGLFGAGYLGYVGARSWDKGKIAKAGK